VNVALGFGEGDDVTPGVDTGDDELPPPHPANQPANRSTNAAPAPRKHLETVLIEPHNARSCTFEGTLPASYPDTPNRNPDDLLELLAETVTFAFKP
jgi:hypothetical protein